MHDGSWVDGKYKCLRPVTALEEFLRSNGFLDKLEGTKELFETVLSAKQLQAMALPDPVWVVPGLLVEGLTLLAGAPKLGKSWMALNVALAVALGGRALGVQVEQGSALVLALEDSLRRIRENRLQMLSPDVPLPGDLFVTNSAPRTDQGLLDYLRNWLSAHPDCRLVVIDTLARIRPPRKKGADVYQEDVEFGASLQKLALESHIALLVIHHDRKAQSEDWVAEVSGSFGLTAACDAVLGLKRTRGTATAKLHAVGRDMEEQELALSFDKSRGLWGLLGPSQDWEVSEQQRQILTLLREASEPLSPKEVHEVTGLPSALSDIFWGKLIDQGLAEKTTRGRYAASSGVQGPSRVRDVHDAK